MQQPPVLAPHPHLRQRKRQQRNISRFIPHIVQQPVHQSVFERETNPLRRLFNGAPQFIARHHAQRHLPHSHAVAQLAAGANRVAIKIGP